MSEREILFRGKRADNGEWIEGYFLPGNERQSLRPCIFVYHPETQNFECFDIDIDTLGEYTGLTDKNGTRIFEGDIVRYENYEPFYDRSYLTKDKVVFADGEFTPIPKQYNCEDDYYSYEFRNFEVIGNIYDNPELLKN